MKLYLGGPMRGYANYNYNAFEDASLYLEAIGHEVISPHQIDLDEGYVEAHWFMTPEKRCAIRGTFPLKREFVQVELTDRFTMERALRRDIETICNVEGVAFLQGWLNSQGCQIEDKVREWLGLPRFMVVPFTEFREDVGAYRGVRPQGSHPTPQGVAA